MPLYFFRVTFPACFLVLVLLGCSRNDHEEQPLTLQEPQQTDDLRLSIEMRERLGVEVSAVSQLMVQETIPATGWLTPPPTSEVILRAPVTGFVESISLTAWPDPGHEVTLNQPLAQVKAFLSPQELAQMVLDRENTEIQIQQALITMELSEEQLKRVVGAGDAVTGSRVFELKQAYQQAQAAHKEAQEKPPFLLQEPNESNGILLKPIQVVAARSGRILEMHVASDQWVQAGDPLWTIGDWSTLWLRVPVFDQVRTRVIAGESATLNHPVSDQILTAARVNFPVRTNSVSRTVDLYFSVTNQDWSLLPGQSLTVHLPISGTRSVLTISRSAVLYDAFRQPSCYVLNEKSDVFQRTVLELASLQEDRVIVSRGLHANSMVVTRGAEQLAAEDSRAELEIDDDD